MVACVFVCTSYSVAVVSVLAAVVTELVSRNKGTGINSVQLPPWGFTHLILIVFTATRRRENAISTGTTSKR